MQRRVQSGHHAKRPATARGRASEAGLTLVELLVTVMIMGIAMAALIGTMQATIVNSTAARSLSKADVELRRYAETLRAAGYLNCEWHATTAAHEAAYEAAIQAGAATGATVDVHDITYWHHGGDDELALDYETTCPLDDFGQPTDDGLQKIQITVTLTDGTTKSQVVTKRQE